MRGAKLAGARDLTIATDWSTRSESDGVEVEEEEEDFLLGMLQTFCGRRENNRTVVEWMFRGWTWGECCRIVWGGGQESKGVCWKQMQLRRDRSELRFLVDGHKCREQQE